MKLWKCSVCGNVSAWGDSWCSYSSPLIDDEYPALRIITCSNQCLETARSLMSAGRMKLPVVKLRGMTASLTKDHIGYAPQPEQHQLLEEYNQQQALDKYPQRV